MRQFQYHIRPIRIEKDAAEIASLVRKSFRKWLDYDNLEFLNHLEKAGNDAVKFPLWTNLTGFPYSITGVVCTDEKNMILGVITTYPFVFHERSCCLVANVCVDSLHRNRGIATQMLNDIVSDQQKKGLFGLYLQTRLDNSNITEFYRNNGFIITDVRETWILPKGQRKKLFSEMKSEIVLNMDMCQFQEMFERQYPESVRWNLNYSSGLFSPGNAYNLLNRITLSENRFYKIVNGTGEIISWAALQSLDSETNVLWFIPNKNRTIDQLSESLSTICQLIQKNKVTKLDVPAGISSIIFQNTGFIYQQTLAWMYRRL